jgi:hypothetical protein
MQFDFWRRHDGCSFDLQAFHYSVAGDFAVEPIYWALPR